MIVERALTAYLRYKHGRLLRIDPAEEIEPPTPRSGAEYLLYLHIPFCEELCPYCSFNRFPLDRNLAMDYFRGLTEEIRMYADLGFNFAAVYVGGGTPTVLPVEMTKLLATLRATFRIREISLETNPHHLTDDILRRLKDSGVNRLSVGVQTFDDDLLRRMERFHKYGSGAEIKASLDRIKGMFDTLNVDMIFNFPTQTLPMIEYDVRTILEIEADQVTFYPLMVSEITRKELARRFGPISYRQEKLLYRRISEMLDDRYSCGTAWCFSRKKTMIDEYIVDYDEYVGAGSGSFGYVGGSVWANTFSVRDYLQAIGRNRFPLFAKRDFSLDDQIRYDFMMKLFGTSLHIDTAEKKFHGRFMKTLRPEIALFKLVGALVEERGVLRLTRKGRYLWVIMMREFFSAVNNFRDVCRARITASGSERVAAEAPAVGRVTV
ncbi:MAG: coproporphyrinogen III oxidase family protein [Thermodesulfobacteriota bacterium]